MTPDGDVKSVLFRSALVFFGAGFGGTSRYLLGGWLSRWNNVAFPWETFTINVSGSFVIGLLSGLLLETSHPTEWRLLLIVGFLGGYTTFSSFSLETLTLLQQKSYSQAFGNAMGSCLAGVLAAWLGLVVSRLITRG
jgi:CrcB protein